MLVLHKVKWMMGILTSALFVIIIFQSLNSYKLWENSIKIKAGYSRQLVHELMGTPTQEWAKASSHDIWAGKLLLGELKVDVIYIGNECNWHHVESFSKCTVEIVHKRFQTLKGNNWFLSFEL